LVTKEEIEAYIEKEKLAEAAKLEVKKSKARKSKYDEAGKDYASRSPQFDRKKYPWLSDKEFSTKKPKW
jgi:hypothetical protein